MNILAVIATELRVPDDQGRDWYGWASNQLAHAFLGVCLAVIFPWMGVTMAAIVGTLKELGDIIRAPQWRTVVDSLQDVLFWVLGAWVVVGPDHGLPIMLTFMAIIMGVIPRARRAYVRS